MSTPKKKSLKATILGKPLIALMAVALLTATVPIMVSADESETYETIISFDFGTPEIVFGDDGFYDIDIKGAEFKTLTEGGPMMAYCFDRVALPTNAYDIQVDLEPGSIETMTIDTELQIRPAPVPVLLDRVDQAPILEKFASLFSRFVKDTYEYKPSDVGGVAALDDQVYTPGPYGEHVSYQLHTGRDDNGDLSKFVSYRVFPCVFDSVSGNKIAYVTHADLRIDYKLGSDFLSLDESDEGPYDLLILSPSGYLADLQPLVDHKEEKGFDTKLVCLDEIYDEVYFEKSEDYSRDKAEEIKYFIYNAVLDWDVKYVMAVGGWRTLLGLKNDKYTFPIRNSHNVDGEPGYIAEQYYSCCVDENGDFDSWDSNGNDVFAEWHFGGWDEYEPYPDVSWGRLACRNKREVRTMVDKIIWYEDNAYDTDWFYKMLSVTGDGFQDQSYRTDTSVAWDISGLPNGDYSIHAISRDQSPPQITGNTDIVNITIDRAAESRVTFSEMDHTKVIPLDEEKTPENFPDVYPAKPVTEIVVPSDGDILGNTDVNEIPSAAYIGERWAVIDYNATNEILMIRTKSYNPVPHDFSGGLNPFAGTDSLEAIVSGEGSHTYLNVVIFNSDGNPVSMNYNIESDMYYEGEVEAEQALYYAGDDFEKNRIWTSNGEWINMVSVIDAFSEGYGLAYINGHSSCLAYGDHFPGIPGGRGNGQSNGLAAINTRFGLERYAAEKGEPLFPLDHLTNGRKTPIFLYSGCHSGQFDTALASMFYDPYNVLLGDRYGTWTPEGVAWWITRLPQGGSIATIGNAGLGSGYIGDAILIGLTGWLFPTFFYNYQTEGYDILGDCYKQTLMDYSDKDDPIYDQTVRKHFEQWDLLGDPTLKIGGYEPDTGSLGDDVITDFPSVPLPDTRTDGPAAFEFIDDDRPLEDSFQVTYNEMDDTNPESLVSDQEDDKFLTGYWSERGGGLQPGFAYSTGGAVWDEIVWPILSTQDIPL